VCYAAAFKYGNSAEARGIGYQEEISPTLQAGEGGNQKPVVCYPTDSHQQDSRFKVCEDGVCPTVPGQMGTGGNNGPMVLHMASGQSNAEIGVNVSCTLTNDKDRMPVCYESSKPHRKYIIRRLTPLECCRLQGMPDGWTDGVSGSDSAKYKMWGNGMALPCVEFVIRRIKEAHDNGH